MNRQVYEIRITEQHLKGNRIDHKDCPGARAFKSALARVHPLEDILSVSWMDAGGMVNLRGLLTTPRYVSKIGRGRIRMMHINEYHLGKKVTFELEEQQ